MLAITLLFGCLADPSATENFSRAAAIDLYNRNRFAEAGAHMTEVYRRAKSLEDRRAAAAFVVGAYSDAFFKGKAEDQAAAAELLCRGLAVADDFIATGGVEATRLTEPRAVLAALRAPFGECEGLMPVSATPRAAPTPQTPPLLAATTRPEPPDATTRPEPPDATTRPEPDATTRPEPPDATTRPEPPDATTRPEPRRSAMMSERQVWLWTGGSMMTLGAVTAGVGLGLGLSRAANAAEGADALTAGAPGRGFTEAEKLKLQDLRGELIEGQTIVGASVGAGAALLVSGAVLMAVGLKRRGPRRAALVPWRRGVAFTLRF